MDYQNLKFMQDTFFFTQNICSWSVTPDMQLLYSNCPEQGFFFDLFSVSACRAAIQEHFAQSAMPLIATDRIGFVWLAVSEDSAPDQTRVIHLLGPVFTSHMTEKYLSQHYRKMTVTPNMTERLWRFVNEVPTITSHTASCYASMLHYCVNGHAVKQNEVEIWSEQAIRDDDTPWGDVRWHGSWATEQMLLKSISEGRFEDFSKINTGIIGNIGGGDPLRQAKNEIIVFAALCSRAAVDGGISYEGSMNLSDFFIQQIEAATTVSEAHNIGVEMHSAYIQRVQAAKANQGQSHLVRSCAEYVATHILEKITLPEISQEIGYTAHHISRKFKSETGESLSDYINRQKIQTAQVLLRDKKLPVADISDRLAFSTPSYFSSVFKKQVGITPIEFQKKCEEEK